jgi:hypothetical protein
MTPFRYAASFYRRHVLRLSEGHCHAAASHDALISPLQSSIAAATLPRPSGRFAACRFRLDFFYFVDGMIRVYTIFL